MSLIVSFDDYVPAARYDDTPWTQALIYESDAQDGTYTLIDTITFDVPDSDPSDPGTRSFTTANGTAVDYWYYVTFADDDGNESLPTVALQNTIVARTPYADVTELAGILHITQIANNETALTRVLTAASTEIDAELGRDAAYADPPALVVEVCLERAVEHWQQMKSPFGVIGLGAEAGPTLTATDSWNRHANKLAPLKESWGIA